MKSKSAIVSLTTLVMVAFAANSVIGRAALKSRGERLVDPATYTTVRVIAGAIMLAIIQWLRRGGASDSSAAPVEGEAATGKRTWLAAAMLSLYAICFSFAYVKLDTASGTLILFAFVQITMVSLSAMRGEKPNRLELVGLLVAFGGLVYLVAPAIQSLPLLLEAGLMMLSGLGWGIYTVLGKENKDSIAATAANLARSVPFVLLVSLVAMSDFVLTPKGCALAVLSGAITTGLGYALWYIALRDLRSTQAAAAQLSVPILASAGGVLFAGDSLSTRTVVAGLVILAGIAIVGRAKKSSLESAGGCAEISPISQ